MNYVRSLAARPGVMAQGDSKDKFLCIRSFRSLGSGGVSSGVRVEWSAKSSARGHV